MEDITYIVIEGEQQRKGIVTVLVNEEKWNSTKDQHNGDPSYFFPNPHSGNIRIVGKIVVDSLTSDDAALEAVERNDSYTSDS